MQKILIIIAVILSTALLTLAKEWKGIAPLISTRAEVIRLLGDSQPPNDRFLGERFTIDGETVYIRWVRADCRDEENIIAGTPPPDSNVVVHQITVDPKSLMTLEDVKKIDPPKESPTFPGFKFTGPMNCIGSGGKWACSTINPESGFGYSTNTDKQVVRLYYTAAAKEYEVWSEKLLPCVSEIK